MSDLDCHGDDCLLAVEYVCLYMDHVIEVITMVCEMCCIVVEVFVLGCYVGFVCFTGYACWSSLF